MEQGPGSRGASGAAAASPHLTDAPLQRPTLRVQDGDIIEIDSVFYAPQRK